MWELKENVLVRLRRRTDCGTASFGARGQDGGMPVRINPDQVRVRTAAALGERDDRSAPARRKKTLNRCWPHHEAGPITPPEHLNKQETMAGRRDPQCQQTLNGPCDSSFDRKSA